MQKPSHLITVFDAAPAAWAQQARLPEDRGLTLRDAATAAVAFVRAFLLLMHRNDVSFLVMGTSSCDYVYPPRQFRCHLKVQSSAGSLDGGSGGSGAVDENWRSAAGMASENKSTEASIIWEGLRKFMQESEDPTPSAVAEAEASGTTPAYPSSSSSASTSTSTDAPACRALAPALSCAMGRARVLLQRNPELDVRVLVLLASGDYRPYYIPLMNTIFSAEHLNVGIDCINVGIEGSKFMQQACHQTGGTYQHLDGEPKRDRAGLLQHMLCHFLPSRDLRNILINSASVQDVDLRASCFGDGSECEIGVVCSICLSIFKLRNFMKKKGRVKTCDVCNSIFKPKRQVRKAEAAGGQGMKKRDRDANSNSSNSGGGGRNNRNNSSSPDVVQSNKKLKHELG